MTFYRPHDRVTQPVGGPSRTKQAFKEECDVNNILRKYEKTGLITHVAAYKGRYEIFRTPSNIKTLSTPSATRSGFSLSAFQGPPVLQQ